MNYVKTNILAVITMTCTSNINNASDINPFLRFARRVRFRPLDGYMRAGDCHFYYILSEYGELDTDGTTYSLKNGTVILLPAEMPYAFRSTAEIEVVSINFDYTQRCADRTALLYPVAADTFDERTVCERAVFSGEYALLNKPLVLNNMHHIEKTLDAVLREYVYKKQYYAAIASGLFKGVLFEMLRDTLYSGNKNESIDRLLGYIHSHYAENITNEQLSKLSGYHPYHLNRLMKQFTGTTLHQYLIDYRIETAKSLLQETTLPISTIAAQCGYPNASNFSCDFRRKTTLTPSDYRNKTQHLL
jgi:AraC-like DNA-binding protein